MGKIQLAMGEKLGGLLSSLARAIIGLAYAFAFGPKLALVLLGALPFLAYAIIAVGKITAKVIYPDLLPYSKMPFSSAQTALVQRVIQQQASAGKANGVADEVITLVRTVWSFGFLSSILC